jgi:hypothetical protein
VQNGGFCAWLSLGPEQSDPGSQIMDKKEREMQEIA